MEKNLKYKIQIDDTDLGSQLDQIKNRVDTALASSAMGVTPPPQAANLIPDMRMFPPSFDPATAHSFGQQLDQNFWKTVTPDMSTVGGGFFSNLASSLDATATQIQTGYKRFVDDARRFGLIGGAGEISKVFSGPIGDDVYYPQGFWQNAGTLLSPQLLGGYDPHGPVSSMEYRERAASNLSKGISSFLTGNAFAMTGTATGLAIGGLPGAFTGFMLGSTADFATGLLTGPAQERAALATGIMDLADANNIGNFTRAHAGSIARDLQQWSRSPEALMRGFSLNDIQENIVNFANAGGFSGTAVNNVGQFRESITGLLDNIRQVQYDLNVFSDEAAQIMGQLQNKMVATSSNIGEVTSRIKYISEEAGTSPIDILNFGLQGSQMVRGTGISAGAGFNLALDARLQAERMAQSNNLLARELVSDYGGPTGAATALMETTNRWMLSGQGMLALGGMLGGARPGGGLVSSLAAAGGFFSNPADMLAMYSQAPKLVGAMGLDHQVATMMGTVVDRMRSIPMLATGEGGTIRPDVLAGYMVNSLGMSPQDSWLMVNQLQSYRDRDLTTESARELITGVASRAEAGYVSLPARAWGHVRSSVANLMPESFERFGESLYDLGSVVTGTVNDILHPGTTAIRRSLAPGVEGHLRDFTESAIFNSVITRVETDPNAYRNIAETAEFNRFLGNRLGVNATARAAFGADTPLAELIAPTGLLNQDYLNLFKTESFGLSDSAKKEMWKTFELWEKEGNGVTKAQEWLDTLNSFEGPGVDTNTARFESLENQISANILAATRSNPNIVKNANISDLKDFLANKAVGKDFASLTGEERRALRNTVSNNSELSYRLFGGKFTEYGSKDDTSARISAGISQEIGGEMDVARDAITNITREKFIEERKGMQQAYMGTMRTSDLVEATSAEAVERIYKENEERLLRGLRRGDATTSLEGIDKEMTVLRQKIGAGKGDVEDELRLIVTQQQLTDIRSNVKDWDVNLDAVAAANIVQNYSPLISEKFKILGEVQEPGLRSALYKATLDELTEKIISGERFVTDSGIISKEDYEEMARGAEERYRVKSKLQTQVRGIVKHLAPAEDMQIQPTEIIDVSSDEKMWSILQHTIDMARGAIKVIDVGSGINPKQSVLAPLPSSPP